MQQRGVKVQEETKTSTGKRVALEKRNFQLTAEIKQVRRGNAKAGKAPKKKEERQVHKGRVTFQKKEKQELIRVYNQNVATTESLEALYRKCANECLGASKENGNPRNDKDRVVGFFKELRRLDRKRVKHYQAPVLVPLSKQQTVMTFHMPGPAKKHCAYNDLEEV